MPLRTIPDRLHQIRPLIHRYFGLFRALAFVGSYGLWVATTKLIILSLITYFLRSGAGGLANSGASFEEINDSFVSAQLSFLGLSALGFVLLLHWMNPLTSVAEEIFAPKQLERGFLPAFALGSLLATALVLAFILTGQYQHIGFFIQFEELPSSLLSIAVRSMSLAVLIYCEEYIFRERIARHLRPDLVTAMAVAVSYCAIRDLQFDLGVAQLATMFLISVALSLRSYRYRDFTWGAGVLAGLMIVIQPILSLPILGADFSGLLLVKPTPGIEGLSRLMTGGAGGPLSSFAFQIVLLLDIIRSVLKKRRTQT